MLILRCCLLMFCASLCPSALAAGGGEGASARSTDRDDRQVRRNFRNTSKYLVSGHALILKGTTQQIMRMSEWLDEILRIPIGRQTVEAIFESGNHLTLRHSEWALHASGRTLAPVSSDLTNGTGSDVEILFDVRIPEHGSHAVFDAERNSIEFTAVQNLFHELVHAKHLANGTWRYFDSEGQAIEEENIFRQQYNEAHGLADASLRAEIDGRQIWWPDN